MRNAHWLTQLIVLCLFAVTVSLSNAQDGSLQLPTICQQLTYQRSDDMLLPNTHTVWQTNPAIEGEPQILFASTGPTPTWDWSPDGMRLVFAARIDDTDGLYTVDFGGDRTVMPLYLPPPPETLPGDTMPFRRFSALEPQWSPDGRNVAFIWREMLMANNSDDLAVIRADGSGFRQLTQTPDQREAGPRWSPDSTRLLFYAGRPGSLLVQLYTLPVTSPVDTTGYRERVMIGEDFSAVYRADWNANGGIAFMAQASTNTPPHVYVYEPQTDILRRIDDSYETMYPRWSPDGRMLALRGRASEDNAFSLRVVDGATGALVMHVDVNPGDSVRWSPDGTRLAYSYRPPDGGASRLAVLDISTGLVSELGVGQQPVWRPCQP